MQVKWINLKDDSGNATLYSTNITFNKIATTCIENAYRVSVGINNDNNIIIKPITKTRYDVGDLNDNELFTIAVKTNYSRISNTQLMKVLGNNVNIEFTKEPQKFDTTWDETSETLTIHVSKGGRK